jgi:hypothetical protein
MYIIAQVLLYTVSGIILPFKILPISWYSGKQVDIDKVANFASAFYYRPSGIFIEPGFAAQFLLPGFVLSLYGWISGKVCRYKEAILILVALVLTTSTQAILIGAVLLAVFAIPKLMKQFKNSKRFVKVGIVMCALILCAVILNLEITQITISKLTEATRGGSSVSMRLYRGMAVFMQLPFLFKVLGIGHGNLGQFVMDRGIRTIYDPAIITPATADYANGMSTVALFYGVIGLGLLFLLYLDFLRHTKDAFRLIALAFILLSLVSNVFFDISIVFYFSLIYAGYRNEKVCLNSEDVISEADIVIS